MMRELFRHHDLNGDGVLEELELVQLNKKIALLHQGDGANTAEVAEQYRNLFRSRLDPSGNAIAYDVFRRYMADTLNEMDPDEPSQMMILEQFVAEAESGHRIFRSMSMYSDSDEPLLQSQVEPGGKACPSEASEVLSGGSTAQPEPQVIYDSDIDEESDDWRLGEGL